MTDRQRTKNKEQREMHIEIKNEVISASAGTGKTFNLAVRYIKLLIAGVKPETIVALTFSRKAAGEIFDRIILLIGNWIEDKQSFDSEALGFGIPAEAHGQLLPLLREVLDSIHKLPIGTLDSFFVRIIQTFPFEFGLNGDFEILDELMIQQAKEKVFKHILWKKSTDSQADSFLEEFKQATFGREEKKLNDLLHGFVDSNHAAFMETLGGKPWGERSAVWPNSSALLDSKVDIKAESEALNKVIEQKNITKSGNKFPIFFEVAASFKPSSHIPKSIDGFFKKNLLGALPGLEVGECDISGYNKGKANIDLDPVQCQRLAGVIKYMLKCRLENSLEKSSGIYQLLKRYETAYDTFFRRNGKLTFNDVLHVLSPADHEQIPVLTNRVSEGDKLFIDYRLDSSFDHWMLDEFQDTSHAQWMVIKNLIDEVIMDAEGRKTFFYVGDTKQAIYGWRGGDASLFDYIHKDINDRLSEFEMKTMSDSYRSGPQVIDTVNRVFSGMKDDGKTRVSEEFLEAWKWPEHHAKRTDIVGYSTLIEMDNSEKLKAAELFEKKVGIIADEIKTIQPFDRELSVAVLVRSNKKGQDMANLLELHGIPTALEGNFALDDNDVVKALLSLIKFAEHPGDHFAWQHLRMTPFEKILWSKGKLSAELRDDIGNKGFAHLIIKWTERLKKECGVELNKFCTRRVDELISVAQRFDSSANKSSLDFIDLVKAYKIPGDSTKDAVQILTIHKSKGLEYDIVFMPEMNEKNTITAGDIKGIQIKKNEERAADWAMLLPERNVAEQDEVLAEFVNDIDKASFYESLCVLYVGMTRAAKALYMLVDPAPKSGDSIRSADIVRDTLFDSAVVTDQRLGEQGGIRLYENGSDNWFEHYDLVPSEQVEKAPDKALDLTFSKRLIATSPSSAEKRTIELSSVFTGSTNSAMDLGTAVHAIFEEFEDIREVDASAIATKWQDEADFPDDMKDTAAKMFLSCVKSGEVCAALTRPTPESEVWIEKGFEVVIDNEWITGFFDRVTLVRDETGQLVEAIILDYKTDKINGPADIEAALETYAPQLAMYQKVLSRLTGLTPKQIRKQLLLVRTAQVVEC